MSRAFLVLHGYTNHRRPEGPLAAPARDDPAFRGASSDPPGAADTDDPHLRPWVDVVRTELDLLAHADEQV